MVSNIGAAMVRLLYDTLQELNVKKTFQNDMLMNSLTNIVNEYYARDISRKVIQARKAMQETGSI